MAAFYSFIVVANITKEVETMTTTTTPLAQRFARLGIYKLVNPIFRMLVRRFAYQSHKEQEALRILRVRGRKSGKLYDTPIRFATFEGSRYLVALLEDAQWVRNLRAVGTAEFIAGKDVEPIHAHEIQGAEKTAFLMWYAQQPEYATSVQFALGLDKQRLTSTEIDRAAQTHPVFRIESTQR